VLTSPPISPVSSTQLLRRGVGRARPRRGTGRGVLQAALVAVLLVVAFAVPASRQTSPSAPSIASIRLAPASRVRPIAATPVTTGCASRVAPYLYLSWGSPQDPVQVMQATGLSCFTIAFILSGSSCQPLWGSTDSLSTSAEAKAIASIRAAGGDAIASSGGSTSSISLEVKCSSASALAAAYNTVIATYSLKAFDIDLEGSALSTYSVQDKVLQALKLVKAANPSTQLIMTIPSGQYGLHSDGRRLLTQAASTNAPVDIWSIMPFDFGNSSTNMASATTSASEALHASLKSAYPGRTDATLYAMQGISTMNGITDSNEIVSLDTAATIQQYAAVHGLGRLTFWALNRDRPCQSGLTAGNSCSGIAQQPLDFTKLFLQGHL
jgi:alpha-galactosidase